MSKNPSSLDSPGTLHPWLEAEANGDPELRHLISIREGLFVEAAQIGGADNDPHMRETGRLIGRAIVARQTELGIDPLTGDSPPQSEE